MQVTSLDEKYRVGKEGKKQMKTYHVKYLVNGWYEDVKGIDVLAKSKAEAYDKAVYELIPEKEGREPFGAYVHSVTYSNGNYREFNNNFGDAY